MAINEVEKRKLTGEGVGGGKAEKPSKPGMSRREFLKFAFLGATFLAGGGALVSYLEKGGHFATMAATWQRVKDDLQRRINGGETTVAEATQVFNPTVTREAAIVGVPTEVIEEVITNTPEPIFTPAPTETLTPGRAEVDAVLNAENDAERTVAALALSEYLNANTPTEAYVGLEQFGAPAGSRLFWSDKFPYGGRGPAWAATHNTDIEPDYSLLPEAILAGMTSDAGEDMVFADGEWSIVPKVNIPGLGEMHLREMIGMNQEAFKQGVVDYLNRPFEDGWSYLNTTAEDRFALPVIMFKNNRQTSGVVGGQRQNNGHLRFGAAISGGRGLQIPGIIVATVPTNHVLMPLVDPETGKLFGWKKIIQGITTPQTNASDFNEGDDAPSVYSVALQGYLMYEREFRPFGAQDSDSFAVLLPYKDPAQAYEIFREQPVLERGADNGIGSSPEILSILNAPDADAMLRIIEKDRLTVAYPDIILHKN